HGRRRLLFLGSQQEVLRCRSRRIVWRPSDGVGTALDGAELCVGEESQMHEAPETSRFRALISGSGGALRPHVAALPFPLPRPVVGRVAPRAAKRMPERRGG